jgi:hypothetical protein
MIVEIKIKLTTPILGELNPDSRGVRRFRKTKHGGEIAINSQSWQSQWDSACKMLSLNNINTNTILPQASYASPSIHLYRRVYSKIKVEFFESIRAGTVLTMQAGIRSELPGAPDFKQFENIIKTTGQYFGISQWGSKFGFGRYNLISLIDTCPVQPDLNLSGEAETSSSLIRPFQ